MHEQTYKTSSKLLNSILHFNRYCYETLLLQVPALKLQLQFHVKEMELVRRLILHFTKSVTLQSSRILQWDCWCRSPFQTSCSQHPPPPAWSVSSGRLDSCQLISTTSSPSGTLRQQQKAEFWTWTSVWLLSSETGTSFCSLRNFCRSVNGNPFFWKLLMVS